MKATARLAALFCILVGWMVAPSSASAQIAIITHPEGAVTEMSLAQLRDLFLGRAEAAPNGARVVLFENRELRASFYELAFELGVRDVKRRWISVVLSGGNATPPEEMDADEVVARVAMTEDAMAFVDVSRVDPSVRVVRIDGLLPGDPEYPVR